MQAYLDRWERVRGGLIVSCQASPGDAFYGRGLMAKFAEAAAQGGAAGIRANGSDDVHSIRAAAGLPIIGIQKSVADDGRVLITPRFEDALALCNAGASAVAFDCTARGQRYGALERINRARAELAVPVMADIATAEEAEAAVRAGADFVLSTMRGYTDDTRLATAFEPSFIAELVRRVAVPVIAEGRLSRPEHVRAALDAGAFAVVVGSAITRPQEITRELVAALRTAPLQIVGAVDLGATSTKWGLVRSDGQVLTCGSVPTHAKAGTEAVLGVLRLVAQRCVTAAREYSLTLSGIGLATAGWVDRSRGCIVHATGNIPGWTGADVASTVTSETGLRVSVDNDGVAAAAGEWLFGAGKGCSNILSVTLGTGIGGGAVVQGRLLRGAHGLANMLGHIPLPSGTSRPCNCGLIDCFEGYAGARAVTELIREHFPDEPSWRRSAQSGDADALALMRRYAGVLARGIAPAIQLLDPELVVLSGGMTVDNSSLAELVQAAVSERVLAPAFRNLRVRTSQLGNMAGVRGAAAILISELT